jgi:hypothetical protein
MNENRYHKYKRQELEDMCVERRLILLSEKEACFTKEHLIRLLLAADCN